MKISFCVCFLAKNLVRNRTVIHSLTSIKDLVNPKYMKGVYSIPCSCGIPYIRETNCSINQRIQEHAADIKHDHSHSSALVEHAVKSKYHVFIEDSQVITRVDHFHHRKLWEVIEIEKHDINLNRDDGWKLIRSWIHVLPS